MLSSVVTRLLGAGVLALAPAGTAFAQESCDVALPVSAGLTFFDNTGATTDGPSNCGLLGADLWFRYDATAAGTVTVATCDLTFMDTVLNAYESCKGPSIICTDDSCGLQTRISFGVAAGQDYFLQVGGFDGEQGGGAFILEFRQDGACCISGSCSIMSEAACAAAGGVYSGDATTCAAARCDELGACCLPADQGLCVIMLPEACTAAGGTFSGAGTTCLGVAPFNGSALLFSPAAASDVSMGDVSALALTSSFTIEAWVLPTSTAGITRFVTKGSAGIPGSTGYGLGQIDGRLRFTTYGVTDYDTVNAYLTPGEWTHVAAVMDAFNSVAFYVNGAFVEILAGNGPATTGFDSFQIGANAGGNREHFDGVVDEVRVWNVERTAGDIADNFDVALTGNEFGLLGYWRMDEGMGDVVADSSPNAFNGTRNNAEWIGTQTCESATFGACCLPSGQCVLATASGCEISGGAFSGNGTSCGTVACPQPGACCLSVEQGLCRVLLPAQCEELGGSYAGPNTSCDNVGPFSGAALAFDEATDGVDNGNPDEFQLSAGFTLEAWIYPTTVAGVHRPVAMGQPGVDGFGFGVFGGGRLRFTTFGIQDYNTVGSYIQPNRWSHIAVVFTSGFTANYYVNGEFVEAVQGTQGARATAQSLFIGRNSAGGADAFVGRLDEIRVWNTERSATDIADSFDQQLAGNEAGLVGYWQLDEGTGTTTVNEVSGAAGNFTGVPTWLQTEACGGGGCPADFNNDDLVNSQDFFDFLTAFFATAPNADFNNDDIVNSQDFFDFLTAFFAPC